MTTTDVLCVCGHPESSHGELDGEYCGDCFDARVMGIWHIFEPAEAARAALLAAPDEAR